MDLRTIVTVLAASGAVWGPFAAADERLRNASVFVEAEEFGPLSHVWRAGQGWADDIYSPTSADGVLVNDGGGKEQVHKDVTIPADGVYNVWVRYLKIGEYPGSFGLRITQNGQAVFDQKYRTQPKKTTWDPVWEKFPATLKAGPAALAIYIAQPGIRQRIDCVLLTSHLDYGAKQEPDYRDFGPQVFFRYRFMEPAVPTTASVQSYIRRGPVYYNDLGYATKTGLGTGGGENPPASWSPWYEITKIVDTDKYIATVHLHLRSAGQALPRAKLDLQVAPEPHDQSGKTLHEDLDGDIVTVLVPGNLRKYPDALELASRNTRKHVETARGFFGPSVPDKKAAGIKLETYVCGFGSCYNSKRMLAEEMEVACLLGMNAFQDLVGVPRQTAAAMGVTQTYLNRWIPYQTFACPTRAENAKIIEDYYRSEAEKIRKDDSESLRIAYRNKLYDEPGTGSLDHVAKCASCTAAFREYLKQRGLVPAEFGKSGWDQVGVIKRDAAIDLASKRLYYWSVQFRDASMAQVLKWGTDMTEKYLGQQIWAAVNFTNGGLSDWAGGLIDGPDWFLVGRERAQSMMWSEDWTSLGPDGTGYAVDVLRSAGSPHRLPVGMYLIANDATTLPLRTCSALMHGAKCLNFYCYGPYYAFADGTLSENVPAQKALAAVTREIAKADHLLAPGIVPSTQVAVSYFKSHEIWQTDTAIQVERRNTYLALTHDNYPVDFLDEPMVEQGLLGWYRVLYLVDSNVSRTAAVRIRDWVAQGGTLVACAGAGLKDEYDQELPTLREVFGVRDVSIAKLKMGYRERYDLPGAKPADSASFAAAAPFVATEVPVIGYRETIVPSTATVAARFSNQQPAALVHAFRKGRCLRFGFLPAVAYAKDAKPSTTKVTVGYVGAERQVITAGAQWAKVARPVVCSVACVETNLLSSSHGRVVLLANWTMEPIRSLTVTVRPNGLVQSVESVKQGRLPFHRVNDAIEMALPLGATDILLLH